MDDLPERLARLSPTIEKLMKIGGTAGLSLGVLHERKVVHLANYGFRDVELKLKPNEETIYPACSLTKALIGATIGTLIQEGKIEWDTLLKDILPDFKIKDETVRQKATITDILTHQTGMSVGDYYLGAENNILISSEDSMAFLSDQKAIKPFRGQFQYNNLGYELAGHVIDKVSGASWADLMRGRIIEPLKLQRTLLDFPSKDDKNVAKAYNTLDDASPIEIATVQATERTFSGAAAGLRTCVKDLLSFYDAFIYALNDQTKTRKTSTPGSPFMHVNDLVSPQGPLDESSSDEGSYALGWARVQLPGKMGAVGCNPGLMPDGMPIVGKGAPSILVIYHQGSLPGALSAVVLVPQSHTAIVAMTNSLALCDTPDWVAQLLLEEILDVPEKNDYIAAAHTTVESTLAWYPKVSAELEEKQQRNTSTRDLQAYVGTYWNEINTMKIVVTLEDGKLFYALQGLASEKYPLDHYENDIFSWLRSRNEYAARGRWVDQGAEFWLIKFWAGGNGMVDRLTWVHDLEVKEGESFFRKV